MVLAICRLNQSPIDKELCIMTSKNVQILKPKYLNFSFLNNNLQPNISYFLKKLKTCLMRRF